MFLILSLALCGQTYSPSASLRSLSDAPLPKWLPPAPGDCATPVEPGEHSRQRIRGPKGRRGKALKLCDTLYRIQFRILPKVPGESRRAFARWTSETTSPGASDA